MAEQILDQIRDYADGQIDFEGQKLAELLSTVSLAVAGAIAFVIGYVLQDIKLGLYVFLGGSALTFLIVVPAWPFFNQHPLKWLPIGGGANITIPQNIVVDEKMLR